MTAGPLPRVATGARDLIPTSVPNTAGSDRTAASTRIARVCDMDGVRRRALSWGCH